MKPVRYFARNIEDKRFDDQIRDAVRKNGSKVEMALYIQNQEILNLLRHLVPEDEKKDDLNTD